ncbi:Cinnamyl alcohol dehydrogenase [Heracleum sosnowskyi]|uniref:Cinnamyl alcohol dehydrogenase n=1 Tax=Heracleum sosnowskyi TaxID=360622 RepID=A0AAD8J213_9APIA|nr:Cinnamyl alcohol dehydrogenase [Heracleum sosnowskyi]
MIILKTLSASGDSGIPEVVSDPQGEVADTFQNLGVCVVQQCAKIRQQGITIYNPLKHFGLDKPGMHISIVGLGGLGHVAVKFAKAFGTKVTVISTSLAKKQEAIEHLGAGSFLVSRNPGEMQVANNLKWKVCFSFFNQLF